MEHPALTLAKLRSMTGVLRDFYWQMKTQKTDLDTSEVVEIGLELWRLLVVGQELNHEIKEFLRHQAGHAEKAEFQGKHGSVATVHRSPQRIVLRDDVNLVEFKQKLGDAFYLLFTVQTRLQPQVSFQEEFQKLDLETQQVVLAAVDIQQNPSRVNIR